MDTNNTLLNLSPASLRRAAQIKEQIDSLASELGAILSGGSAPKRRGRPPGTSPSTTSASATGSSAGRGRRRMSAAARAKIAAAAKARWARAKAAGKSHL